MKKFAFRNTIKMIALVAFVSLLVGCPYESAIPISDPDIKASGLFNPNKKLLGKWIKEANLEDENPTYYVLSKKDKYHYSIVEYSYDSDNETWKETNYVGHLSDVDGTLYFNIDEIEEDEADREVSYYLYKIEFKDNARESFTLYEVTDNITETFTSPDKLKSFISENQHLSFFFNSSPDVYVKQK